MELDINASFRINGEDVTFEQFISPNNKLENIKESIITPVNGFYRRRTYSFSQIEEMIPERDRINIDEYIQAEKDSEYKIENDFYKDICEIKELIEKVESSDNTKLTYMISKYGIENILTEEERKNDLLIYLLINGYIDENYEEYINYFYEGALRNNDKNFLISLQSQKALDYDYQLSKYKNLIEDIPDVLFSKKEIFNIGLLDFMLENYSDYEKKLKIFFQQLCNEADCSVNFCTEFLRKSRNKENFIKRLYEEWSDIWEYMYANMNDDTKKEYIYSILKYVSIPEIQKINDAQLLSNSIATQKDFISSFTDLVQVKKMKQIISIFDVKFETMDANDIFTELGSFIIANNYYKINKYMINLILEKKYKISLMDIENKNYTSIQKTEDDNFIQYIENNFIEYIENVYLVNNQELADDVTDIINIINNENVSLEHKYEIVKRQVVLIENLENVNDDIWEYILEKEKMILNWKNIICYFSRKGLSSELIKYINNNKEKIISEKIQSYNYDVDIYNKFNQDIVLNEQIDGEILNCINYKVSGDILNNNIENTRIRKIIEKNNIVVDDNSYQLIKENYNDLLIVFIENNINFFVDNMDSLSYDTEEIEKILMSERIEDNVKEKIVSHINENIICTNEKCANIYVELIISSDTNVFLPLQLLKSIIEFVSTMVGIELLITQMKNLNKEQLLDILDGFVYPYNAIRGQQIPKFEKNEINDKFIEGIKSKRISNVSSIREKNQKYYVYKKRK